MLQVRKLVKNVHLCYMEIQSKMQKVAWPAAWKLLGCIWCRHSSVAL